MEIFIFVMVTILIRSLLFRKDRVKYRNVFEVDSQNIKTQVFT